MLSRDRDPGVLCARGKCFLMEKLNSGDCSVVFTGNWNVGLFFFSPPSLKQANKSFQLKLIPMFGPETLLFQFSF